MRRHVRKIREKAGKGFHKVKEKTKHVVYRTKYVVVKVKERARSVKEKFNKKDVAQMLTSLFVIIQIYTFRPVFPNVQKALLVFGISIITSGIILWLVAGKREMFKHLLAGTVIVIILSLASGYVLGIKPEGIIIASSAALPVATMVDLLKR